MGNSASEHCVNTIPQYTYSIYYFTIDLCLPGLAEGENLKKKATISLSPPRVSVSLRNALHSQMTGPRYRDVASAAHSGENKIQLRLGETNYCVIIRHTLTLGNERALRKRS